MIRGQNYNHPGEGDVIRVEPIRNLKDIKAIKKTLINPRDLALFVLGINTNLRASDLLKLTAGQVRHLKVDDELVLREKKTGKIRRINLNKTCVDAIQRLIQSRDYKDEQPLFYSSRGQVLTGPTVTNMVKEWCQRINLKGNYGSHTLRKTWGYHQRVSFGRGVAELMVCFNHGSERQTLDYLCIQPEEIRSIYRNEL